MAVFITLMLAFSAGTMALALPDLLERARKDFVVASSLVVLGVICLVYLTGWFWFMGLPRP